MTRLVHSGAVTANLGTDVRVGRNDTSVGPFDRLRSFFLDLWPSLTAPNVAGAANISVRSAERFLAGQNGLSAESLLELLATDDGLWFLEIMMGERKPKWWRSFKRHCQFERLREQQASLAAQLDDLEQERKRAE